MIDNNTQKLNVTYNTLPEAVSMLYQELIQTKLILADVLIKLKKYEQTPPREENQDELLTIQEACIMLKIKPNALHRWKKEGIVPYRKIGTRTYFKKSDLENYNKIELKKPKGIGGR